MRTNARYVDVHINSNLNSFGPNATRNYRSFVAIAAAAAVDVNKRSLWLACAHTHTQPEPVA